MPCQQQAACCTALRSSTACPIALNIPPLRPLTSVNMQHGNYVCNIYITYMHNIHTYMHANSQINTIMHSADAVQAARNSASGWGRTSSSCLCSCAPLHHASSQPCYAMLQSMQQTTHIQCNINHNQCSRATLLQVPYATIQIPLLASQLARYLALELG